MRVYGRYLHILVEQLENVLINRYTMERHNVTNEILKLQKQEEFIKRQFFKEYLAIKKEIREVSLLKNKEMK